MKKNREMKIGMLLNYISMILEGVVIFLLNPFIIRSLGQETYGVYSLMTSFTGYISIFEFGLGTTIIRYVSKYNEEKNEKDKENFLSMIALIYLFITVIIIIFCIILYNLIDNIFAKSLSFEQILLAKKLFVIIASSISITTIGSVFSAIISGYEKFIFSRMLILVTTVLNVILSAIVLITNPTAIFLTIITLLISIITIIANIIFVFTKLKVKIKFHKWDKIFFNEIFKFAIFIFLQTLITQIYWRLDQLIIGIQLKEAAVSLAVYAVAMKINDLILAFTTVINRYQLPTITKMVMTNDKNISEYIGKISKFVSILYIAIIIGFIFFGQKFIQIYAGNGYDEAYYIVLIVVIASSLSRINGVGSDVLKAKNSNGLYTLIVLFSAILNILFTIFLIPKYGIIGASVGTAISVIIGNTIAYYWCLRKKANIELKKMLSTTFDGFGKVVVVSVLFCLLLSLIEDANLIIYFVKLSLFAIIYLILIYKFVLDKNLKNHIKMKLRSGD